MLYINPFPIQKHVVRSVIVDSLFIVATTVSGCFVFCLCFLVLSGSFQFCNHLDEVERASCFA